MKQIVFLVLFTSSLSAFGQSTKTLRQLGAVQTVSATDTIHSLKITDRIITAGDIAGLVTKTSLGLGNVDNTSDASKPVSTATQTALDGKANTSHTHTIANVTSLQTTLDAKVDMEDFATLSYGSTVSYDGEDRQFPMAKVTATGSFTLDMTDIKSGSTGTIKVITNTASAITVQFDTDFTNKSLNTSLTSYTLPAGTGKEYFFTYIADGTTLEWIISDGTDTGGGGGEGLPSGTAGQTIIYNGSNVGTATTLTGDVTVNSSGVTAIGSNKVTYAQMQQVAAGKVLGNLSGSATTVTELNNQDVLPGSSIQTSLNTESGWSGDTKTVSGITAPGLWYGTNATTSVKYIYTCTVDGTAQRVPAGAAQELSATGVVTHYSAKSGNYTLTSSDHWIEFSATATATLPAAGTVTGQEFLISTSANVTITLTGTINGSTSNSITGQYKYIKLKSNGTEYRTIGAN